MKHKFLIALKLGLGILFLCDGVALAAFVISGAKFPHSLQIFWGTISYSPSHGLLNAIASMLIGGLLLWSGWLGCTALRDRTRGNGAHREDRN